MSSPDDGDYACSSSDRRYEDEQLFVALRATGLRGRAYDDFIASLINYATGVLWKMVREDKIWAELVKIDRPRTRPAYWGERDKEQLVKDSITAGFLDFSRTVLVEGR